MKRYGLVFKIEDQCWLAEYVNGTIEDASAIDDTADLIESGSFPILAKSIFEGEVR